MSQEHKLRLYPETSFSGPDLMSLDRISILRHSKAKASEDMEDKEDDVYVVISPKTWDGGHTNEQGEG